jgi:hydroxyacylglutathione hydrolase
MIFQQFYLKCLAHASYMIADEGTRIAAVVDPQRDVDLYLAFAREHDLRIEHVILTHLHADFVAGHLELRHRVGARIYLGASAHAEYAFTPLKDGDAIDMGRVRLQAIETPGHTPESICVLVFDRDRSDAVPHAVLTGDTLFVGDVGRPDLHASIGWTANELGRRLYNSVRTRLLPLPDSALVYPAHGAGSLCGRALGTETFSTIGEQRRVNYALQPMTEREFIALVTADQPDAPAYFTYDAALNSRERPTLTETIDRGLTPLSLETVTTMRDTGAQVLDTRDAHEFAAAHMKGSLNVGLGGQYATWAGSVIDPKRPLVVICESGSELESEVRLGRIGFDNVAGYLEGGMAALADRPDLISTTIRLGPANAQDALTSGSVTALDVRTPAERAERTIAGSLHMPLSRLSTHWQKLPTDRPLLLFCAGGYRSSIAASLLESHGLAVREIAGGLAAWELAKLPIETAA